MIDKRYLKPSFVRDRILKGPRVAWKNLSKDDQEWITKRAKELNLDMEQTPTGTKFSRTLKGRTITGYVEYIVDFGWKSEPDTARLLIEAIDKQIFDDAMQKNPAMLLPLLARDVETLQQEIGFTELSHVYNSLAMGRPKEELH